MASSQGEGTTSPDLARFRLDRRQAIELRDALRRVIFYHDDDGWAISLFATTLAVGLAGPSSFAIVFDGESEGGIDEIEEAV